MNDQRKRHLLIWQKTEILYVENVENRTSTSDSCFVVQLMALQHRFGTDERFRMDERFLEEEEEMGVLMSDASVNFVFFLSNDGSGRN